MTSCDFVEVNQSIQGRKQWECLTHHVVVYGELPPKTCGTVGSKPLLADYYTGKYLELINNAKTEDELLTLINHIYTDGFEDGSNQ